MPLLDPMAARPRHSRQPERPAINEVDYIEPTNGSLDQSEVIGREVEVSFLVHDLIANSKSNCNRFMALGVAGTAGSGKTTICQKMFNDEQVQGHFLPRMWVCMTKQPWDDPDPKVAVAERMLTCLGEDEEIIEEKKRDKDRVLGLVSLLHRHLVGKRYLIVLDDAWDADEWYNLGFAKKCDLNGQKCEPHMRLTNSISDDSIQHKPNKGKNFTRVHSMDWSRSLAFGLPKGYGGAVIVNGRSDTLVEMMVGKENLHHLLPLTEEDCWAIFTKASGGVDLRPVRQVVELRRCVMQGAGGHPLMAKLMGQCYRDMQPQVEDTAQQATDNGNVSTGEESAIGQANNSNGSSIGQVSGLEAAQFTALQRVNSSSGSSTAQVIGPELAQVTAPQPLNSSSDSSTAQVTGLESAQVTTPQRVNSSSDSSIAQVIGLESAQVTASQLVNSSNDSSTTQITWPELAQVTAPQPINSSSDSSKAQVTGPELAQVTAPQPVNSSSDFSTAQITELESAQVTAPQRVNSSNDSSIAQVTGLQVTAPQTVNSSNDSSTAQVTRLESAEVIALQPVNISGGSSTAQVTGLESAQVTAQQLVNRSNGSSTDQVTRLESTQVTALGSSIAQVFGPELAQVTASGSSIAQVTGPELAQVTTSQPVNSSTGSPMEEFIGPDRAEVIAPQLVDSGDVKKNWLNRTKSLGSFRIKFPFGLGRSKTMGL